MAIYGGYGYGPQPFNVLNAQNYQIKEEKNKGKLGGVLGFLGGGALGVAASLFKPLQGAKTALMFGGAVAGAVAGFETGEYVGKREAIYQDGKDNYMVDGSPQGFPFPGGGGYGYGGGIPYGYGAGF